VFNKLRDKKYIRFSFDSPTYIDTMNVVFTFLYAVFYDGNHTVGFVKDKEFVD